MLTFRAWLSKCRFRGPSLPSDDKRQAPLQSCAQYSGDMRRATTLLSKQLVSQACLSQVPDIPRASFANLSYQRIQSSEFMASATARHAMLSNCNQNGRSFVWFSWAFQGQQQARQVRMLVRLCIIIDTRCSSLESLILILGGRICGMMY